MTDPDRLPSLDALGARLSEVAQEHLATKRRSRWPRSAVIAAVLLGGGASIAGAAALIGIGSPVKDDRGQPERLQPGQPPRLAVTLAEPSGAATWGVSIYEGRAGADCALAGRVRFERLGQVAPDGTFAPLARDTVGACGSLARRPVVFAVITPRDPLERTLVFGRAKARRVRVTTSDGSRRASTGPGGAFLAVYQGRIPLKDVSVVADDRRPPG